jgi:hypothetical protein
MKDEQWKVLKRCFITNIINTSYNLHGNFIEIIVHRYKNRIFYKLGHFISKWYMVNFISKWYLASTEFRDYVGVTGNNPPPRAKKCPSRPNFPGNMAPSSEIPPPPPPPPPIGPNDWKLQITVVCTHESENYMQSNVLYCFVFDYMCYIYEGKWKLVGINVQNEILIMVSENTWYKSRI